MIKSSAGSRYTHISAASTERVAQGRELPVHHGANPGRVVGVQDGVVDPVVAVHDRSPALLRNRFAAEPNAAAQRRRRGGRRVAAPAPTANPTGALGVPDIRWVCRNRLSPTASGSTLCRSTRTRIRASTQPSITGGPAPRVRRGARTTCPATYSTIWNGAPSTESSSHRATARATGTGVSCRAATTLYSRAMSCADGVSPCSGGRRSTHLVCVVVDQEGQIGAAAGDQLGP